MTLKSQIGFFSTTNIVIANMVGVGIFTTSGLIMAQVHSPIILLLLWLIGGLIALCGALSYGALGAAMPDAGGEYLFLSKLYHPLPGFLSGWISFIVGFSAPIAASAIGCSAYIIQAFPVIMPQTMVNTNISEQLISKTLAILIITTFTIVHARGLKSGTKVQNLLTTIKLLIICSIITGAIVSDHGNSSHFTANVMVSPSLQTLGLSLMWVLFAYSGWNAATYIGSEIKNPARNLPLSLLAGTLFVVTLYLLLNMVFILSIPPKQMEGVIAIGGLAMKNLFGSEIEKYFSLMIALALFSSISAFIIIGPRVYYAMARDQLFFKSLAAVHPVYQVPTKAIVLQGIIATTYVITGTFDQILTYMGFALGIFPILTVSGLFKLPREHKTLLRKSGYPIIQVVFILASISILILAYLHRPFESSLAIIALSSGIPVYYYFRYQKKTQQ